jgi:Lar family restriction alleviation protein
MTDEQIAASKSTVENMVLKPCPFCGGEPICDFIGLKYVRCVKCGAKGPWFQDALDTHDAAQRAANGWNQRFENAALTGGEAVPSNGVVGEKVDS